MERTDHNANAAFTQSSAFELAVLSEIGDRTEQQDSFGYAVNENNCLVVVCDGMGGHSGGKIASSTAVDQILQNFTSQYPKMDAIPFLKHATFAANSAVCALHESNRMLHNCGTTLACVLVDRDALYWSAVGDSRIYLFRAGELIRVTVDHNYGTVLDEQLKAGVINQAIYEREVHKAEGLISYLGLKGLPLVDYNKAPLMLQHGDVALLMSDGAYRMIPDERMCSMVANFLNIQDAVRAISLQAKRYAMNTHISQDNLTVAIIKIK